MSTYSSTIYLVKYILLFICKPDISRIDVFLGFEAKQRQGYELLIDDGLQLFVLLIDLKGCDLKVLLAVPNYLIARVFLRHFE